MKKKVTKKKSPEIDIKIKNIDKNMCCSKTNYSCSGFWIFGSSLAMILSYERSSSILWAILHGIFGWFYVLFRSMQIWGWF
jgi:hypothetical protein